MADSIRIERIYELRAHKPKPDRRGKLGEILTYITKLAIDYTVNSSLKTSTVGELQELKDRPFPLPSNEKNKPRDPRIAMEEIQARMEKRQHDLNNIRQHKKISAKCVGESEALKKISDENVQAKMEKMLEDINDTKHEHKVLAKCMEESEPSKKKPEEDKKEWGLIQKNRKRVFIRSRL